MVRRLPHFAATLALLVLIGGAVLAEDAPAVPPPAQPAPAAPAPEPSWFTPPGAACRQWSDGCHVCIRSSDDAAPSCSTPSIACVQTSSRCLGPVQ